MELSWASQSLTTRSEKHGNNRNERIAFIGILHYGSPAIAAGYLKIICGVRIRRHFPDALSAWKLFEPNSNSFVYSALNRAGLNPSQKTLC